MECKEHRPLIVSLEAKRSVLVRQYLSIHLNKKLADFTSKEELAAFLEERDEDIQDYLKTDEGDDSFHVIDDRARLTTVEDTFKLIERAIVQLETNVIIFDVQTDLTDTLTLEQQNVFNGMIKSMIAKHNVCIISVCHTKKIERRDKEGNQIIEPTRHDIYGTKMTVGSATSILILWRDLHHQDPIERNTTYAKIDKNRDHSVTGSAGRWYYDINTHRMINREDFNKQRGF